MVTIPTKCGGMVALCCLLSWGGASLPASARSGKRIVAQAPAPVAPAPAVSKTPTAEPSSPPASEPPLQVPAKLSLKQALELALAHNADYQQSLVNVANSESRLRSTNQLRHVAIGGTLEMGHSSQSGTSTLTAVNPTLSISQPNGAGLNGNLNVMPYSSPEVGGQAGLDYTLPYFDVVRAKDLLKVQEQAVAIAEEATKDAQKRLDAGLITEIDVTRAQLQLSNTREQLIRQQQSHQNAVDTLVMVLGLPVGAQPELTDTVSYNYSPIDEATAIQAALEHRPELALDRLNQANADVQTALAHSHKKPSADVHFNLASIGFSLLGGGGLANVLTSLLGLRVNVPVKERALQENVAQAERNRSILDEAYEFRRQRIVSEVRSLVRQAEAAKDNVDLLTANLEVAKRSLHIAHRMIEEGLADNRNLLDAQSAQTSAESGVLSAKVDYFLSMASLRQAMGQSLRSYFGLPAETGIQAWQTLARGRSTAAQSRSDEIARLRRLQPTAYRQPSTPSSAPPEGERP